MADVLGVPADNLRNEETSTYAAPLSRTQWENIRQRYEDLLPDGPDWPAAPTYEAFCEQMIQFSEADKKQSSNAEWAQITIRPALVKDFPSLLDICKARYKFDSALPNANKRPLPTFESQLDVLTRSLVGWISAGQCFLMEANGCPGAWFVLQLPEADDYPVHGRRRSSIRATAATPLPRAAILGPYTNRRFLGASGHMLAFCQACCPRLEVEVPLDDQLALKHWLYKGFVPSALAQSGQAIFFVSPA